MQLVVIVYKRYSLCLAAPLLRIVSLFVLKVMRHFIQQWFGSVDLDVVSIWCHFRSVDVRWGKIYIPVYLQYRNMEIYTKADVPRLYESLLEKLNSSGNHGGDTFRIACRLFGEQSEHFLPQFISDTQRYYNAEIKMVTFVLRLT